MFNQTNKLSQVFQQNSNISIIVTHLLPTNMSCVLPFKRSISFEQKIVNAVSSLDVTTVNNMTYDLIFDNTVLTQRKGYLINFADNQIQSLPKSMFNFRKALNVKSFCDQNPQLNIKVNAQDFSSLKQLNQRFNGVTELIILEAHNRLYPNDVLHFTHGSFNTNQRLLAYQQTAQNNCDYYGARVLKNGQIYTYYADLKTTDKATFLAKIASLHPNRLIFCQIHFVGGVDENFIFNTHTKTKLIQGCQIFMANQINANTPLAQYQQDVNNELKVFDGNPTIANYNSISAAPWRIFTVSGIKSIFNIPN